MIDYTKLMSYNPTEYERFTNSLGQVIIFYEHPTKGDESPVICACPELELAAHSTFFETDDMLSSHKEYEPTFKEGSFYIGDFKQ